MIRMSQEQFDRLNRLGTLTHVVLDGPLTKSWRHEYPAIPRNIVRYLTDEMPDPSAASMWFMMADTKTDRLIISFTDASQALAFQMRWL